MALLCLDPTESATARRQCTKATPLPLLANPTPTKPSPSPSPSPNPHPNRQLHKEWEVCVCAAEAPTQCWAYDIHASKRPRDPHAPSHPTPTVLTLPQPSAEAAARDMHQKFLFTYGVSPHEVPLLRLDVTDFHTPFSDADLPLGDKGQW